MVVNNNAKLHSAVNLKFKYLQIIHNNIFGLCYLCIFLYFYIFFCKTIEFSQTLNLRLKFTELARTRKLSLVLSL